MSSAQSIPNNTASAADGGFYVPPPAAQTVYVVVHGVGDPNPGETTRDLARGLTAAKPHPVAVAVTEGVVLVPELDPEGLANRLTRPFLVPIFRDEANRRVLAEVNWADLSRFPLSLFGLFEGLVSLLFGLRHIAAAAAISPADYAVAKPLRLIGWWVAWLLVGPLAASNILMLFLLGSALLPDGLAPGAFADAAGDASARFGCVLAALAGLGIAGYFHHPVKYATLPGAEASHTRVGLAGYLPRAVEYRRVGGSLFVLALGVLAAVMAMQYLGVSHYVWYVGRMPELHDALVGLAKKAGQPAAGYTEGVVLYAAVAIVPMAVVYMLATALSFLGLVVYLLYRLYLWCRPDPDRARAALVAALLPFTMLFGWLAVIPFAWVVSGLFVSTQSWLSEPFRHVYQALLDYLMTDLPLMFFGLGIIAAAAVVAVVIWHLERALDRREKRMIVATLILSAILLNGIVLPVAMAFGFKRISGWLGIEDWAGTWASGLRYGAVLIPFLPLAVKAVAPRLRGVLDLVFDVATHFRPKSVGAPTWVDQYPTRNAIRQRLAGVVAFFAKQAEASGAKWNLVIVSHSQGTMAVLSFLNDDRNDKALAAFHPLRLVTMGSPFSHIYQHYFRHHYPALSDANRWATLHKNLDPRGGKRWLNVYRVDDYVGREIEDPWGTLVDNKPVTYFGHTDYWSDGVVMDVLIKKKVF